ncbi:MAG TPA: hypothetical protein VFM62_04260 [Arthrobacter sp.]|nr:hypothetical protein [Arthrobacter sp.]
MESAGHDEPRGECVPAHHELDTDPDSDRSDGVSTPKRRTRRVLWAGGITILMIATAAVGVVAFSPGNAAIGDSAIPVDERAVFDNPPSLKAAVLDGWHVTNDDDSLTSVRSAELRCEFQVRNIELNLPEDDGKERIFGDIAATEGTLSGMSEVMMQALGSMRQVGELEKLNVPRGSSGEHGLEFITMRLDYFIPGSGEPATIRFGARSMPSSGATLSTILLCPTSVLEDGEDPWKKLMANTTVVAGEQT